MTLCFSAAQALLAAKAGAYIVSPFVGRVDDLGWPGMKLIEEIVTIYSNYSFKTQILAASLRGPLHVVDVAKAGAHIATLAPKVLDQLFYHPLTEKGMRPVPFRIQQSVRTGEHAITVMPARLDFAFDLLRNDGYVQLGAAAVVVVICVIVFLLRRKRPTAEEIGAEPAPDCLPAWAPARRVDHRY